MISLEESHDAIRQVQFATKSNSTVAQSNLAQNKSSPLPRLDRSWSDVGGEAVVQSWSYVGGGAEVDMFYSPSLRNQANISDHTPLAPLDLPLASRPTRSEAYAGAVHTGCSGYEVIKDYAGDDLELPLRTGLDEWRGDFASERNVHHPTRLEDAVEEPEENPSILDHVTGTYEVGDRTKQDEGYMADDDAAIETPLNEKSEIEISETLDVKAMGLAAGGKLGTSLAAR